MIDKFTFGSWEEVLDWTKRLSPISGYKIFIDYVDNRFHCYIKIK